MMNPTQPLPNVESEVLAFWQREHIFDAVVASRQQGKPFTFYDGPPFTTGLPHYGHIMQMAYKDAVLRYKTMHGFTVPRKIGWDTHGLPVEYQLEKELKISGKRDIETFGIEKFVEAARGIVLRCTNEWKFTMERMGRWVDVSHPYATMDNNYMESVWWAFKTLYNKGLVYQDFRVSPYCPRCGTVLSNFEVNLGYKDNVNDPSVFVRVPISTDGPFKNVNLVLWTTTPWTLPSNVALAVDESTLYTQINHNGMRYIVAADLVNTVFGHIGDYEVEKTLEGKELVGLEYEPLYPLSKHSYRVVPGHHVTVESGTGIVHIAPAFGEDDFVIGKKEDLPLLNTVDPDGKIKKGYALPGEGKFVKDADHDIRNDLFERHLIVAQGTIKHTYPFCWRCDSPLLYYPTTSWYVKVTALKDDLIRENSEINWQPEHLRDGRFGKWLEGARDWAISRERYWGAPLPVWQCTNNEHKDAEPLVVGSREELRTHAQGEIPEDLHRPYIDSVQMVCSCGSKMARVPYVFDCWFESGSMPFAQHHYPFTHDPTAFDPEKGIGYPADFIAEALDQTRGWFYTLHVLGVALFGKKAYKNVVVSGLLLAADGKKLSKSLGNYTAPEIVFDSHGVDAMRLFLFTAATIGEDYRFSDQALQDVKRRWIVPFTNVVQYYTLSVAQRDSTVATAPHHALLDRWIEARVAEASDAITDAMTGKPGVYAPFDLVRACRTFGPLVEDVSTWYVRLSRGRRDAAFTHTLQQVLRAMAQLYAPFLPFLMESVYQQVKTADMPQSVHLCDAPALTNWRDAARLTAMDVVRTVVTLGRTVRVEQSMPLRQPLAHLVVTGNIELTDDALAIIAQELAIDEVVMGATIPHGYAEGESHGVRIGLDTTITPALKARGVANALRRSIQDLRKQSGLQAGDSARVYVSNLAEDEAVLLAEQLETTELITQPLATDPAQSTNYTEGERTLDIWLYTV